MTAAGRTRRALLAAATAVAGGGLLAGCMSGPAPTEPAPSSAAATTSGPVSPGGDAAKLAASVPQRSVGRVPAMRLAKGLVPPTNRWFSGLVFGPAQQVFPYPLSFTLTKGGFSTGLPGVSATPSTIMAAAGAPLSADLGASSARVSAYDEVSVTLEYRRGGTVLGHLTIAEGSPTISYRAARATTVRLGAPVSGSASRGTVRTGTTSWGVVTTGGRLSGATASVPAKGSLVLVALPGRSSAATEGRVLDAAASPLVGVTTFYGSTASGQRTTLRYRTASGGPVPVVPLPHQGRGAGCTGAGYATIYGTVPLCLSRSLAFTTPTVKPTASLDLSRLTAAERKEVGAQLKADVAANPAFATDTYFGGKTLYRSAMLLSIADELGDAASKRTLLARLTQQLDRWTEPGGCTTRGEQCFVYDPALRTVVGLKNSFGSEQVNDHHFHYGYFLYAAGVAAKYAPAAAKRWAPVMDMLAADIASRPGSKGGSTFPTSRVYDPYFSHSWASGFSPFADGNNQESTSEAITAWTGLSLWAAASKQRPLAAEAAWLLSGETASALRYWINPDLRGKAFAGFDHDMVSLTWGGKRDFATWFSAEPSAIIGIQLIPMSPTSTYLRSDAAGGAAQIRRLAGAASAKGVDRALGDYVLMYRSLAGGRDATGALESARSLPGKAIDNGNSRTYLLAYILANGVH